MTNIDLTTTGLSPSVVSTSPNGGQLGLFIPAVDLTGAADSTAAIVAAVTAAETAGGGVVPLPVTGGGYIKIATGGINVPPGVTVRGAGRTATNVWHTGNNSCFVYNDGTLFTRHRAAIQDLTIWGNNGASAAAIEFQSGWDLGLSRLIIGDQSEGSHQYTNGVGILLSNVPAGEHWAEGLNANDVALESCSVGIRFARGEGTNSFAYTKFRGCSINVAPGRGTQITTVESSAEVTCTSSGANAVYQTHVGRPAVGAGIPAGTTIVSVSGTKVTLSQACTASASGVTMTIYGVGIDFGGTANVSYGASNINVYNSEFDIGIWLHGYSAAVYVGQYATVAKTRFSVRGEQFSPSNTNYRLVTDPKSTGSTIFRPYGYFAMEGSSPVPGDLIRGAPGAAECSGAANPVDVNSPITAVPPTVYKNLAGLGIVETSQPAAVLYGYKGGAGKLLAAIAAAPFNYSPGAPFDASGENTKVWFQYDANGNGQIGLGELSSPHYISLWNGNPNKHVLGSPGDLCMDYSDGRLYLKTGGGTPTEPTNEGWNSLETGESITLPNLPTPEQNGLLGWTFDPAAGSTAANLTAGYVILAKVPWAKTKTVTNILTYLTAKGVTLTSGQNLLAIYSSAGGAPLAVTVDQTAAWEGALGPKVAALTAPTAIPGAGAEGFVYIAGLANGSTTPKLMCAPNEIGKLYAGAVATARAAYNTTGNTSFPSLTLSAGTAFGTLFWGGLD